MPFTATAGPDGDAYDCYGYECARTVYDPNFRSVDGWPQPAPNGDDLTAMDSWRPGCWAVPGRAPQGTLVLDRSTSPPAWPAATTW